MIDGGRLSQSFVVDQQSSLQTSESDVEDRLSWKDIIRALIETPFCKELAAILTVIYQ